MEEQENLDDEGQGLHTHFSIGVSQEVYEMGL